MVHHAVPLHLQRFSLYAFNKCYCHCIDVAFRHVLHVDRLFAVCLLMLCAAARVQAGTE